MPVLPSCLFVCVYVCVCISVCVLYIMYHVHILRKEASQKPEARSKKQERSNRKEARGKKPEARSKRKEERSKSGLPQGHGHQLGVKQTNSHKSVHSGSTSARAETLHGTMVQTLHGRESVVYWYSMVQTLHGTRAQRP
jgi:hypothetical protein